MPYFGREFKTTKQTKKKVVLGFCSSENKAKYRDNR